MAGSALASDVRCGPDHPAGGVDGGSWAGAWPGENFTIAEFGWILFFLRSKFAPMKLILSTQNVTLTQAIEDHILQRIDNLEHLDRSAINARVTLKHDSTKTPERQFSCSLRVSVPGPDLFAEDHESDLYAAIDLVTKKIEQQIRKRHNKYKARNHTEASKGKVKRQEADL